MLSAASSARLLLPLHPSSAVRGLSTAAALRAKRWRKKTQLPFQSELRNPVSEVYGGAELTQEKGFVYDRKPFLVDVEKYRVYDWCGCGLSHQQPFCDATCGNQHIKRLVRGGAVRYIAPETRGVWFCNCKQTSHPPFCDGTHRSEAVRAADVYSGAFDVFEPKGHLPPPTTAAKEEDS